MSQEPRVCIKALRAPFFAAAARTGKPMPELAARADVSPALIGDITARVPHSTAIRVWDTFADLAGDESFGLFAARLLDGAAFDLVDLALQQAPTLGEMSRQFLRYQGLFHDANDCLHERRGDVVAMVHRLRDDLPRSRHLTEFILAVWTMRARRATGKAALAAREVRFRHAAPADTAMVAAMFGTRVVFGAAEDAILSPVEHLDLPLSGADPASHEMLLRQLDLERKDTDSDSAFLARVREVVRDQLLSGEAEIGRVARALAVSERTLQRRLRDAGTSFRGELDEVRREIAMAQLGAGRTTVTDLAFLLGFAELSAFSRAFRRWTGTTPQQFRRVPA